MKIQRQDLELYNIVNINRMLTIKIDDYFDIILFQKEEERQAEIDHENKLLLNKMTHILKYGGQIDNWNNYESRRYTTVLFCPI